MNTLKITNLSKTQIYIMVLCIIAAKLVQKEWPHIGVI